MSAAFYPRKPWVTSVCVILGFMFALASCGAQELDSSPSRDAKPDLGDVAMMRHQHMCQSIASSQDYFMQESSGTALQPAG